MKNVLHFILKINHSLFFFKISFVKINFEKLIIFFFVGKNIKIICFSNKCLANILSIVWKLNPVEACIIKCIQYYHPIMSERHRNIRPFEAKPLTWCYNIKLIFNVFVSSFLSCIFIYDFYIIVKIFKLIIFLVIKTSLV